MTSSLGIIFVGLLPIVLTQFSDETHIFGVHSKMINFLKNYNKPNAGNALGTLIEANTPSDLQYFASSIERNMNKTNKQIKSTFNEETNLAEMLANEEKSKSAANPLLKEIPQTVLQSQEYEATQVQNAFNEINVNVLNLVQTLVEAVEKAKVVGDKKSGIDILPQYVESVGEDADDIEQLDSAILQNLKALETNTDQLQQGVAAQDMSVYGINVNTPFNATEADLNELSENLAATNKDATEIANNFDGTNFDSYSVTTKYLKQAVKNFVLPYIRMILGFRGLNPAAKSLERNLLSLEDDLANV